MLQDNYTLDLQLQNNLIQKAITQIKLLLKYLALLVIK